MTEINHEKDKTKDNIYRVLCPTCKADTKHKVLTSINETGSEPWGTNASFDWNMDFEIIQCLGCDTVSFRSHEINSEHTDHKFKPIPTIRIYPDRDKDFLIAKEYWKVPHNLEKIYEETIKSFNYENYVLCGAGIRAIVEGICQDNDIENGPVEYEKEDGTKGTRISNNLQGKINGLYENRKLSKENADILHEHRFMGNKAVHELTSPSKEDLKLAIEIIENIFDHLYELPNKGLQLKKKRLGK